MKQTKRKKLELERSILRTYITDRTNLIRAVEELSTSMNTPLTPKQSNEIKLALRRNAADSARISKIDRELSE